MTITDRFRGLTGSVGRFAVLSWVLLMVTVALAGDDQRRSTDNQRLAPMKRADLQAIGDCGEMRGYLAEVILETLLADHYLGYPGHWDLPTCPLDGGPINYTASSISEGVVNELDIVKTDDSHIYVARASELTIVKSWPAAATRIVATVDVGGQAVGLFLEDDKALLFSEHSTRVDLSYPYPVDTRIDLIDVANPSAPRTLRTVVVEGSLVGAQMIEGQVYAVIATTLDIPDAAWDLMLSDDLGLPDPPSRREEQAATKAAARAILQPLVEDLVATLDLADMLPQVRDGSPANPDPSPEPLLACSDLYRPAEAASYSVLSVLHLDLTGPQPEHNQLSATGLLGDGWTMYSSQHNLYLAQASSWWLGSWWDLWGRGWWGDDDSVMTTAIHKFELGDPQEPVRYAATGTVAGWPLYKFSLSEHESHLRVATSMTNWWWGEPDREHDPGSLVTVLADDLEGALTTIGRVTGIAPGERLWAVRFMDTAGYVVADEPSGPHFTLDLADPGNPRVAGELELPESTCYLHPAGEDIILAVGRAGELDNTIDGLAVSLLDVGDLANPTLLHQFAVDGRGSSTTWSGALQYHRAFTYDRNILSIPARIYHHDPYLGSTHFSGFIRLGVDSESGIHEIGRIDHLALADCTEQHCLAWPKRSLYIQDYLYSLSDKGIMVSWGSGNPTDAIAQVRFSTESGQVIGIEEKPLPYRPGIN